jgi:hypothetical protein
MTKLVRIVEILKQAKTERMMTVKVANQMMMIQARMEIQMKIVKKRRKKKMEKTKNLGMVKMWEA